jgi:Zn-finger nucleic acid-binding protein
MSWARLLKRVFDIDIDHCPNCGGSLKIIAAIEDYIERDNKTRNPGQLKPTSIEFEKSKLNTQCLNTAWSWQQISP